MWLPLPSAHDRRQATLTTARRQPGRPADKDWQSEATKWKALARKHEKAAKDNADAAKSLADIEESGKTEQGKCNLGNAQWSDGLAKRRWTVRPVSGLRRSAVGLTARSPWLAEDSPKDSRSSPPCHVLLLYVRPLFWMPQMASHATAATGRHFARCHNQKTATRGGSFGPAPRMETTMHTMGAGPKV